MAVIAAIKKVGRGRFERVATGPRSFVAPFFQSVRRPAQFLTHSTVSSSVPTRSLYAMRRVSLVSSYVLLEGNVLGESSVSTSAVKGSPFRSHCKSKIALKDQVLLGL